MRKQTLIFLGALVATVSIVGLTVGVAKTQDVTSGVKVGGVLGSFRPRHVTGADRGTNVCPLCQYPTNPAVQVWINNDDEKNVAEIAASLEKSTVTYKSRKLKAFIVFCDSGGQSGETMRQRLLEIAKTNNLKNVALVMESTGEPNAFRDNEICTNPKIRNTVFVYKNALVNAKFVNLVADSHGLSALDMAITDLLK